MAGDRTVAMVAMSCAHPARLSIPRLLLATPGAPWTLVLRTPDHIHRGAGFILAGRGKVALVAGLRRWLGRLHAIAVGMAGATAGVSLVFGQAHAAPDRRCAPASQQAFGRCRAVRRLVPRSPDRFHGRLERILPAQPARSAAHHASNLPVATIAPQSLS